MPFFAGGQVVFGEQMRAIARRPRRSHRHRLGDASHYDLFGDSTLQWKLAWSAQ